MKYKQSQTDVKEIQSLFDEAKLQQVADEPKPPTPPTTDVTAADIANKFAQLVHSGTTIEDTFAQQVIASLNHLGALPTAPNTTTHTPIQT